MEILDIVDSSDCVIGQASRAEIHTRSLIHRAAHMLLFNSQGQLFFQQRSLEKDCDPGLWDSSAAGHVDSGETYQDCAVREIREELGLMITTSDLVEHFKLPPRPDTGMEFAMVYSLRSDHKLTLDPDEIIGGKWLDPGEIEEWVGKNPDDLSCAFKVIWKRFCAEDRVA